MLNNIKIINKDKLLLLKKCNKIISILDVENKKKIIKNYLKNKIPKLIILLREILNFM